MIIKLKEKCIRCGDNFFESEGKLGYDGRGLCRCCFYQLTYYKEMIEINRIPTE